MPTSALHKYHIPGFATLVASLLSAFAAPGDSPPSYAPFFTRPATAAKAPDPNGFVQRWLLLDPIPVQIRSNQQLTDSFVQAALKPTQSATTKVSYAWSPGRWEQPPRPRARWVAHKWHHQNGGWVLVEGHWR